MSVGFIIPVPPGRKDDLASDIRKLKGKLGLVEGTTWGGSQEERPREDFKAQRFGASPHAELVSLRQEVQAAMFAATGVPQLAVH